LTLVEEYEGNAFKNFISDYNDYMSIPSV